MATSRALDYLIHLRLPFQFLLSPVFLWGNLLARGPVDLHLIIAYVSFHLFGYAGGTALNSAYDRDSGPIGGLAKPPPVPRHLLLFSLIWQGLGFLLALAVNSSFAAIYGLMFLLSIAYSHPRLRWKGKPIGALLTVALGQGVLAYLGGWSAARGDLLSAANSEGVLGGAVVTLLVTGFYPLTGAYQIGQDRERTLARALGVTGSFRFAQIGIAAGGLGGFAVIAGRYSLADGFFVLGGLAVLLLWLVHWERKYRARSVLENYSTTMRFYAALTLPFLSWIAFRLFFR